MHSTELADVVKSLSEFLRSVLRRMITKNATEYHKPELLSLAWLEDILGSHVHEADITQIMRYLRLQKGR